MTTHPSTHDEVVRQVSYLRNLRFPKLYALIVLAGTLDVWLTGILLAFGAQEANPLADAVLQSYGFPGMVIFKYLVVGLVLLGCEFVADHNLRKAKILAIILVVIHASPLPWSTGLLLFAV